MIHITIERSVAYGLAIFAIILFAASIISQTILTRKLNKAADNAREARKDLHETVTEYKEFIRDKCVHIWNHMVDTPVVSIEKCSECGITKETPKT